MAIDMKAVDLGLNLRYVEIGVLHPLAAFENHRRTDQVQAVLLRGEPRLDFRFEFRLGDVQRFVKDDQDLRKLALILRAKDLPQERVGRVENIASKEDALL